MRATPLGRRGAAPAACAALALLLLAAPPTPASSVTTPQVARPLRHSGARWRAGGNGSAALLPAGAPRGPAGRALSAVAHARLRTAAPRGGGGGGRRGAVGADAPPPRQPLAAAPPLHPVERASRARECLGRVEQQLGFAAHATDVVARDAALRDDSDDSGGVTTPTRSFMYVDIVKAASSSIRRALHRPPLGASWDKSLSGSPCGASPREKSHGRTTTACWTAAQLRERFAAGGVWSVVREPSVKFESGVRQIWAQGNASRDALPTADAALDLVLARYEVRNEARKKSLWVNEHLQTSGYRLSGCLGEGEGNGGDGDGGGCNPIYEHLTMLGTVETLAADWGELTAGALSAGQRAELPGVVNQRARGHRFRNRRETAVEERNARGELLVSTLSAAGLRRLCASPLFLADYECFGYPLPPECAAAS